MNNTYRVKLSELTKSVRYAIDIRKMFISAVGLVIYLILLFFSFKIIAFIQKRPFSVTVYSYFTTPLTNITKFPWSSTLLALLVSLSFGTLSFFLSIVARMVHQEIVQYKYPQIKTAFNFLKRRWGDLIFGPMGYIFFLAFLVLLEMLFLLVAKIPYFGEIYYGFIILPLFFFNVFILFLTYSALFIFSTLYPAVAAVEDTTSSSVMVSIINLIKRKPLKLIFYKILLFLCGIFSWAIVLLAVGGSLRIFGLVSEKILHIKFYHLLTALQKLLSGQSIGSITYTAFSIIGIISIAVIALISLGYILDFLVVSDTILYLAFKERILAEDRLEAEKLIYREKSTS